MREVLWVAVAGVLAVVGLALAQWVSRLPVCDTPCQVERSLEELRRAIDQAPGR